MTSFPNSPRLQKGAIIGLDPFNPVASVIVFHYNPDTMTRTITAQTTGGDADRGEALRLKGPPQENIKLDVEIDATDQLERGDGIATSMGVYPVLASLEMLLYPISEGINLLGSISGSLGGAVGGAAAAIGGSLGGGSPSGSEIPPRNVPVTLFVWGPGRIVPVRVTGFTVEEQTFSPLLYPLRATVSLGMTVLQPSAFQRFQGAGDSATAIPLKPEEEFAVGAYKFTMVQKQVLATANLANTVESIFGMLPF